MAEKSEETKKEPREDIDILAEEGVADQEGAAGQDAGVKKQENTADAVEYVLPEAYKGDEKIIQFARDNKFTQEQLDNGLAYFDRMNKDAEEAYQAVMVQEMDKLKTEWGADFEAKLSTAKTAVKLLDKEVPGMVNFLRDSKASTNPNVIRIMEAVGRMLSSSEKNGDAQNKIVSKGHHENNKVAKAKRKTGWDTPPLERLYPKTKE